MQFIDPATGETFECPQGWPSERRREMIATALEQRAAAIAELSKEYEDITVVRQLDIAERTKRFNDDPTLSARATAYGNRVTRIVNRATRAVCKATLETRGLSPEHLALVESDIDGDFYLEQSVPAMEEAGERFQQAYDRGQRGDRKNPAVAGDAAAAGATAGAAGAPEAEGGVGDGAGAGE